MNYDPQTITTFSDKTLTISLVVKPKASELEQVSIQGYKRGTKATTTGSVATLTQKDIENQPASNFVSLLQGKVAGLNIQNFSGQPGSMVSINLNGLNGTDVIGSGNNAMLTPTSPLFVIDGVQVDANSDFSYGVNSAGSGMSPLAMLPPEDIETIEVLKDAAAAGMYGSRGAYGVIVVTTKRGKSKVPIMLLQNKIFYSGVPKLRSVIGGVDERNLRVNEILQNDTSYREALTSINGSAILSDSLNPYYNNATNWQDVFYKTQLNYTSSLNISGGDNTFNYKTNIGFYQEKGIIENTGLTRYTLGTNAQYMPNDKFRVFVSMNGSFASKRNGSGIGLLQTGVATSADATSLLPPPSKFSSNNASSIAISVKDQSQTVIIQPNVEIRVEPVKGFQITSTTNYNFQSDITGNFQPGYTNGSKSYTTSSNNRNYTLYNRNMLFYSYVVQGVHNFQIYAFNELIKRNVRGDIFNSNGSASDYIQGPTGFDFYGSMFGNYTINDSRSASFGGDISYNYKQKYVLDFQYLASNSSTNGSNVGYSKSPVYSFRYNFSKESFLSNLSWLYNGSIRGSWGKTFIPQGSIFDVYGTYYGGASFNGSQTVYLDGGGIPNNNFRPATTTQLNTGIDLGFFEGNKISLSYEFYYKQQDNNTYSLTLPSTSGFSSILSNDKSSVNYGHNITLNFTPLSSNSPFVWNLGIVMGITRDVITKLPLNYRQLYVNSSQLSDPNGTPMIYRLGANSITTLMYNYEGVYKTDAEVPINPYTGLPLQIVNGSSSVYARAGMPKWTDVNGDYKIDQNDLQPLGNPNPRCTGGINSSLRYKQWSLTTNMSFTLARDVINTVLADKLQRYGNPYNQNALYPITDIDYWKTPGQDAKYPYPFDFQNSSIVQPFRYNSTMFMEDGSYWKMNTISVEYRLLPAMLQRFGISQAKVYGTVNNLFLITKYSGPNIENVSTVGRDIPGSYPNPKQFTLGFDIRF